MKKLFAVLMAIALVFSMGTIAFAEGTGTGTITITNAVDGAEYQIFQMFTFEAIDGDMTKGRYSFADDFWKGYLQLTEPGDGGSFMEYDEDTGTIVWIGATETDENGNEIPSPAAVAEFAKDAIAYAKGSYHAPTATKTADASGTVVFDNLPLGYYVIDTSLGTMCALTNTNSTFTAVEKNEKPNIDKFVQEDADNSWGKVNDADIDQQVNYKSTITVGVGATNYVMHDTMEAGLTFNNDVVVKFADDTVVDAANYTVTVSPADGHTFDVTFKNDFIAGLAKGTQFTVYYSATLNENAKVVDDGNDNTVYLSYGEDSTWETSKHTTSTYTWKMDVLKYAKGDGDTKLPLAGAKFQLLANDTAIKFSVVEGAAVPTYKVDAEGTVTEITTNDKGKFEIIGLDEGSYKLRETEAPAGYNKLAGDVDVVITSEHDDAALEATYKINNADPATIEVENKTGSLLPETGGIGTTIFYVVGGLLMVAAFVVLVSKKRMKSVA